MRAFSVVLFLYVCVYVVVGQDVNNLEGLPKYDRRYDYLDLDTLFYSKRLVRNYVDCLINAQRCTPEGKQLKRILPEALRTKCIRCTEQQKRTAVKVIKRLKDDFPEEWAKLSSRWDPTGDFTRYFEVYLANESFNTIPDSADNESGLSSVPPASTFAPLPQVPPRLPNLPTTPPPTRATSRPPTRPATRPPSQQIPDITTPARPVILNRFGDDGELMTGSPSASAVTPRPTTSRPSPSPNTQRPTARPTLATWVGAGSNAISTRFPFRPTSDIPQPYSTAITFIDQIGHKIIRTTELVTDILKSTVRAVVGR
ncbi:unnamed protein product [Diatraea saccharalis]|uniref:Uncharacterized protein n=1 Tax=Diatraea saccharalis TaxID=40085 RepID=A0A9N9RFB6_9NEOP|nr:unnamed protein product [Diatraea saccharalis]